VGAAEGGLRKRGFRKKPGETVSGTVYFKAPKVKPWDTVNVC